MSSTSLFSVTGESTALAPSVFFKQKKNHPTGGWLKKTEKEVATNRELGKGLR
jgi:hypothetical protein